MLERLAGNVEWRQSVRRKWPLATSVLWTNPEAEWDQRRAVVEAFTTPLVCLVKGGVRSGKTTGLRQAMVASLLGGDHFLTRAWCEINGLDADQIPYGPGVWYMVGQSSGDSIKYHRQPIIDLLGDIPYRAYNVNSKGEAWIHIEVAGYSQPATLWFKSVDQGARAHQGISLRGANIDEEPESEVGRQVVTELYMRVADQRGKVWIGMNPNVGITWVHDDIEVKREHDARVVTLDTLHNPTIDKHTLELLFKGMDDDQLAQRRFGQFRSRSGLIYQQWTEGDGTWEGAGNVCEPFDIPDHWIRFRGADYGNVTAILWGALDTVNDMLVIYREHYVDDASWSYEQHADHCRNLEAGERIEAGWGDPNERGAIQIFNAHDVPTGHANNKVNAGIDAIKNRLRLASDNRPRLKVFRDCKNLLREMRGYVWSGDGKTPLKKKDHACDALRYLSSGIVQWQGF